MRRLLLPVLTVVAAALGCAGQLHVPVEADAARARQRWPGTTVADLQRGRGLYVNHCSSCHSLYQPQQYPADKWRVFVDEMTVRAKLSPEEGETVVRYLAASAEARP